MARSATEAVCFAHAENQRFSSLPDAKGWIKCAIMPYYRTIRIIVNALNTDWRPYLTTPRAVEA